METTNNRLYGEFLGYPPCCIAHFGDPAIPFFQRPELTRRFTLNGFLPCEKCAQKLQQGTIDYHQLINLNRKCSVPFQELHTPEQDAKITQESTLYVLKYKADPRLWELRDK